ncbi:hypothetical protein Sjap_025221 [Stephania japonica]|uniref:Protein kinase domain-containing protein n=1 Tax=Stephania japonica TaxID=461633 RepID=A0AAP0HJE4_9MAGN
MVVLICGLGIKMMMDQLIRGPGFMPPPQARPPMAPNLTDHSPNSSNKVRETALITTLAIGALFALAHQVSIPTMNAFRRLATSMDKFSKVASEEKSSSDEDSKAPFPGFKVDHLSWHPARWTRSGREGWVRNFNSGTREFKNELNLLSAIRHENLVPLLGYYCENDQQILVYPFMSNGSLQDCLYGSRFIVQSGRSIKKKVLDWPTRISIALGLFYLHTFAERGVIHRDVKSSNILLGP